eukprot:gene3959-11696_t
MRIDAGSCGKGRPPILRSGGGADKKYFTGADGEPDKEAGGLDHDAFIAKWKADSPDSAGKGQ